MQVVLFALLGIPVYVCASGSTPVAAVVIAAGVSPGAGLAFLIAGPATNVTTFGILSQLHGRKVAIAFGAAVAIGAVLMGWSIDLMGVTTVSDLADSHHHESAVVGWLCVGILLILSFLSLLRQGPRGAIAHITSPIHSHG